MSSFLGATQNRRGRRRGGLLAGAVLFLATVGFILWQNSQVAILWDLSYLLDTSWRIALGQVPYRDFPLVHPPLTFLIHAFIIRVAGRHFFLQIGYAALVGGLGTVLAWRILLRILTGRVERAWLVSLLLAAPLTVLSIHGVYPHPIYDCDCAFAILVAIWMLQRIASGASRAGFVTGAAAVVPIFFKQNMGLPFLMAVGGGTLAVLAWDRISKGRDCDVSMAILLRILAGAAVATLAGMGLIQASAGLGNYLQWTVHFAGQRRLPGFDDMLGVYRQPSFVWTLPAVGCGVLVLCLPVVSRVWAKVVAVCLLSAPFVGSLVYLFVSGDADDRADNLLALWPLVLIVSAAVALAGLRKGITLQRLMPLVVLAAIHGTFLSQQLWGSTYSIWPLLMLLIGYALTAVPALARRIVPTLAGIVCATFLVCGGLYAVSHERLNYVQIPEDESIYRSRIPVLGGMADRGPYLADFEELVAFANREIPPQDGILLLPGEEPFYFATGRKPQFPVQIFDRTTDPYSAEDLLVEAKKRHIDWVILKTRLQSTEDPLPDRERTMVLIRSEFRLYKQLAAYDVYRRTG